MVYPRRFQQPIAIEISNLAAERWKGEKIPEDASSTM
jgi:hypothetical protein